MQKDGAMLLVGKWLHEKHKNKLVEREVCVDTVGLKNANVKRRFSF